jgi:hypothetical protein
MRDHGTVYLLDPKKGYQLSRQGTSGVTCLVERTAWEQTDFRNDIYVPLCYDAEGSKTYLKVIMDVAVLRIQGMSRVALKTEIERRYKNKTYKIPQKAGLSYMVAPVMRTWMMPQGSYHVHAASDALRGTSGTKILSGSNPAFYPFSFKRDREQTYDPTHLRSRKGQDHGRRKSLLDDLCAYRERSAF